MNSYDILKKIKEMYKISTNYFNKYGNLKIIQKNRIRMLEKIGMVLLILYIEFNLPSIIIFILLSNKYIVLTYNSL